MNILSITRHIVLLVMAAILAACGSSSSGTATAANESVQTASYKVEYIPVTTAAEGKSAFKIRLTNRTTGAIVTGKTVTLTPKMQMTGMSHGTPAGAIMDNGDGTYSGTIYYLMASNRADGTSMGTWELKFAIDGETATFNPVVAMGMGTTPRTTLKGITDTISSAMGNPPAQRSYYLFNDGISGNTVKLYIAALDDGMMTQYPAISSGSTLHDAMNASWTANPVTVALSTDATNWVTATDDGSGHWSNTNVTLTAGGKLYVRLSVNGEQKTVDGLAVAGTNGYATFSIASGM
ncbi:hypothetical protein OR1_02007 [Geobacter sp. OR-1]|uniref:hypothetical protein n=1 Tax=Geobacter sp. OR-1 TaxID=1266765 RepID=UPI000541BCDD|nr:hypothetical protein [Geobacter sp. OR-1]GAM09727.1 hypothetical protein OR1_02007 [Geobacter sp. OR-1]